MSDTAATFIGATVTLFFFGAISLWTINDMHERRIRGESLARELACLESGRDFIHGQCQNTKEPKP